MVLNVIQNEDEYELAIEKLNDLLDAGGANENHPLALAVHQLGESIAAYEDAHHPSLKCSTCGVTTNDPQI